MISVVYYDKEMDCIRFKKKLSSEEEEFDEDGYGGGKVTDFGIECAVNRDGHFVEK